MNHEKESCSTSYDQTSGILHFPARDGLQLFFYVQSFLSSSWVLQPLSSGLDGKTGCSLHPGLNASRQCISVHPAKARHGAMTSCLVRSSGPTVPPRTSHVRHCSRLLSNKQWTVIEGFNILRMHWCVIHKALPTQMDRI